MSPDFLNKLNSRALNDSITPSSHRIEILMSESQSDRDLDYVWNSLDPNIMQLFVSNTQRLKEDKLKRFRNSIINLLANYKPSEISKLDADCIKNDGKIDRNKLDHILNDE